MKIGLNENCTSSRFFPHWNNGTGEQVTGFIQFLEKCRQITGDRSLFVEIGANVGESCLLASAFDFIETVVSIDPFGEYQFEDYKKRTRHCSRTYIRNKSEAVANKFSDSEIDILYVDGDHSYESVSRDLELYHPKIKEGGVLGGHDYGKAHPETIKAVDEFCEKNDLQIDSTFIDSSFLIIK
jgi:hypothetical protein